MYACNVEPTLLTFLEAQFPRMTVGLCSLYAGVTEPVVDDEARGQAELLTPAFHLTSSPRRHRSVADGVEAGEEEADGTGHNQAFEQ